MHAEQVAALYTLLVRHGVQLWIIGGWGVDALLGTQSRPHKDLDALVRLDDLGTLIDLLAAQGFTLKLIWEENRWLAHPLCLPLIGRETDAGSEVATAFVLGDDAERELDVHVLTVDQRGAGIAVWNVDFIAPAESLAGQGWISGTAVRCCSAEMQMAMHSGYTLQPKDLQDVRLLHERFGVAYLEEQARHFPPTGP